MKTTRREALQGVAAAAVVTVAPVLPIARAREPDPLMLLEKQFWQSKQDWDAASEDTAEYEEASDRFRVLDDQMTEAVPVSQEGVAAKLRYLEWHGKITNERTEEIARTTLEGLQRLAGRVGS